MQTTHSTESIEQFYARVKRFGAVPVNNAGVGHFNVFSRESCSRQTPYARRDFYKVSLVLGTGKLHYDDKLFKLDQPSLMFSNPMSPYSWEADSEQQQGWYCLFTEAFLHPAEKMETLLDLPLFRKGGVPAFYVSEQQQVELGYLFMRMIEEMSSDYTHKFDVLRNYLHLLIHKAMRMNPTPEEEKPVGASLRITRQFMELLERQFPIDTTETELQLKTANNFAQQMALHVNHLNRALKETTGRTTTELISARVIKEAYALLRHSDWNIAQIGYGLGFEYPAYFNIFFKKHTGFTPLQVRNAVD